MAVSSQALAARRREKYRLRRELLMLETMTNAEEAVGPLRKNLKDAEEQNTQLETHLKSLVQKHETLLTQATALRDKALRQQAEFDNFRKRTQKEKEQIRAAAAESAVADMLPVIDNFDRALDNVTPEVREAAPGLIEGIELTQRDLLSAFEKHKINKISPIAGERFDPKLHQAMFEAPVPNTKAGDIIQVMNIGFTIGDRLLRPAQVGVSSGGPAIPRPE